MAWTEWFFRDDVERTEKEVLSGLVADLMSAAVTHRNYALSIVRRRVSLLKVNTEDEKRLIEKVRGVISAMIVASPNDLADRRGGDPWDGRV